MSITIRLLVLPALLLAFAIGCGKGGAPQAEVSGKVTYKGQPVTGGSMTMFIGEAGYPVAISTDGTYSANQLPEGTATVTVNTEQLNPKKPVYGGGMAAGAMPNPMDGTGKSTGTYVKIPNKYKSKEKSDVKFDLKQGKQTQDIVLKD